MLKWFGKDIHNPKYICPSDLRKEHTKREAELRKQREREAMERIREKAMVDEERFVNPSQSSSEPISQTAQSKCEC